MLFTKKYKKIKNYAKINSKIKTLHKKFLKFKKKFFKKIKKRNF